jgi:riboflavin synthase
MFTGIIESVQKVKDIKLSSEGGKIIIEMPPDWNLSHGESISVNGICLTVVSSKNGFAVFDVSKETFEKTNFKELKNSSYVNLERALKADSRFSGHFVTGHVDGICVLKNIIKEKTGRTLEFELNDTFICLATLVVEKGSIALNGISLTVFDLTGNSFKVAVIPYTWEKTNLQYLKPGSKLNVEFDILGKYILKTSGSKITREFLKQNGFL